jgi:hypothetical protein
MTGKMKCRTPHAGEWLRVNPDPEYRSEAALVQADNGVYLLVTPHMASALEERRPGIIQRSMLFLACNRDDECFLWPVKLPVPEAHFAYRAMEEWLCFPTLQ